MEEQCQIVEKEIGNVIYLEENIFMWKMPLVMGRDFSRLMDYMDSCKCECMEAPFARYLDIDWKTQMSKGWFATFVEVFTKKWHFQAGLPTSLILKGQGDIKAAGFGIQRYVQDMHRGPYQKVGETYRRMYAWIQSHGLFPAPESFEFYINDPRITKKQDLETLVLIPIQSL